MEEGSGQAGPGQGGQGPSRQTSTQKGGSCMGRGDGGVRRCNSQGRVKIEKLAVGRLECHQTGPDGAAWPALKKSHVPGETSGGRCAG